MVAGPAATPLTMPDEEPIVACAGVLEDHVPPPAPSASGTVEPAQTAAGPVMIPGLGKGFTVSNAVAAAVPQLLVTV